jgi:hypothetical protein
MLLAVNLQADNYCERQHFEGLGGSARVRACQLFVRAPRATTCKYQVEEDKAEHYGELTSVDRWEEALRRMSHEVGNRHIAGEDEGYWSREKPNEN